MSEYKLIDFEADKVPLEVDGETLWVYPLRDMTDEEIEKHVASQSDDTSTRAAMRALRNSLLNSCDWINNADVTMSDEKKAEWVAYRQALRDITSHPNFPNLLFEDWPEEPA
jgi:hypothetical protein